MPWEKRIQPTQANVICYHPSNACQRKFGIFGNLRIGPKYGHIGSPALGSSNSTRRSLPRGFLRGCWEHATHLQCFSGVHVFCIVCNCYTKSVTLPETICNLNISFLVAVGLMRSSKASPTIRNREPPCWASCKYRGVAQAFENLKQPSLQQKVLWTQPNKRGSILPMSDCKSGSVFNRSTTSCSKNRSHEKFQKFQTTKWGRSFQNPKKKQKNEKLVGGFYPSEKYARQIGNIFPRDFRGENKK